MVMPLDPYGIARLRSYGLSTPGFSNNPFVVRCVAMGLLPAS